MIKGAACGFFQLRKVFFMQKDKWKAIGDYIVRHGKIFFPVVIIAAVAVTVTIALNLGKGAPEEIAQTGEGSSETQAQTETVTVTEQAPEDVPLVENEDGAIYSLVATYYNAVALGDTETILNICDEMSDTELLRFQVTAQYIDYYSSLEIYTKTGPEEGSTIAYVYYKVIFQNQTAEFPGYQALYICTDENGELYIKRGENSDEVNEYIKTVNAQADVVEFNNRITEEYNQLMLDQPELLEYLTELDEQVGKEVGVILADQSAAESQPPEGTEVAASDGAEAAGQETGEAGADQNSTQTTGTETVQYATATTTVNVRSSDSEQADRMGKLPGGETVQVLEERVNGWTKVIFEGQEGFIKSEYLQAAENAGSAGGAENAAGNTVIGTVTASTNINVRAAASETADRLGILAGGDMAELLANENGWCKINYNGQVGYVKAEYVE